MVTILPMSAKMATLDVVKITVFGNKGYDVMISAHDITKKVLRLNLYYRCGHVTKVW